jgi:hypothetical protein
MSTSQKNLTAGAYILPSAANKTIIIVEYVNPEVILTPLLRDYLSCVGFADIYSNFGEVRVGAVHPFATFLLATVMGTKVDLGILPAITISDSTDGEDSATLGREFTGGLLNSIAVATMKGYWMNKQLLTSAANIARLEAATVGGVQVAYVKRTFTSKHSIDFNIWADNKDLVSAIYDMVRLFLYNSIELIHENGLGLIGGITGRRSGDINIEFGRLLYGANVTASANITASVMAVDIPTEIIDNIEVVPDYHVADGQGEG